MVTDLYITPDKVGETSGGGQVTYWESKALKEWSNASRFGDSQCLVLDRNCLSSAGFPNDPFEQDKLFCGAVEQIKHRKPGIAHCYAGCLTETIRYLKQLGYKVSYTCAAHDKEESRKEHETWKIPYEYPHLTQEDLWQKYSEGYRLADVVVVPSSYSKKVVEGFGCKNVRLIPHGVEIPPKEIVKPFPKKFAIGYMGAIGADKGLPYLLEAWGRLKLQDSTLFLAGKYMAYPWARQLVNHYCRGTNVINLSWVDHVSDFFNRIACYVQPSISEGFGIEVLEAFSYNRPVLCSRGAGACDFVDDLFQFNPRDVDTICVLIQHAREKFLSGTVGEWGLYNPEVDYRTTAELTSWENQISFYKSLWWEMQS